MRIYLRILAIAYLLGSALHVGDLLDLRMQFSQMTPVWKAWVGTLAVLDLAAAIGLWLVRGWGIAIFLLVAVSQLVAYLGFKGIFGEQWELVAFHSLTLMIYFGLMARRPRASAKLA